MNITMFELVDTKAYYRSSKAGSGLKDSVRKWQEAYCLINKNYDVLDLDTPCGLCRKHPYCEACPLHDEAFCNGIDSYYYPTKNDIKYIKTKLKRLQELLKEEKNESKPKIL